MALVADDAAICTRKVFNFRRASRPLLQIAVSLTRFGQFPSNEIE
jgi:hypothetical protein